MIIGLILVAIGIIALLRELDVIVGRTWDYVWPVILIILGLWFLGLCRRKRWWCGCDSDWKRRHHRDSEDR